MKFLPPIAKPEKITRIAKTKKVARPKAKTTTKATKKKSFDFSKYSTEKLLKMYFEHTETARSEILEDTLVVISTQKQKRFAAILGLKKVWGSNLEKANFDTEYYQ